MPCRLSMLLISSDNRKYERQTSFVGSASIITKLITVGIQSNTYPYINHFLMEMRVRTLCLSHAVSFLETSNRKMHICFVGINKDIRVWGDTPGLAVRNLSKLEKRGEGWLKQHLKMVFMRRHSAWAFILTLVHFEFYQKFSPF